MKLVFGWVILHLKNLKWTLSPISICWTPFKWRILLNQIMMLQDNTRKWRWTRLVYLLVFILIFICWRATFCEISARAYNLSRYVCKVFMSLLIDIRTFVLRLARRFSERRHIGSSLLIWLARAPVFLIIPWVTNPWILGAVTNTRRRLWRHFFLP